MKTDSLPWLRPALLCAGLLGTASLGLIASPAQACSLAQMPINPQRISDARDIPSLTPGTSTDSTPPGRTTLGPSKVFLYSAPCAGDGASCMQLDRLEVALSASDNQTRLERLRYAAYFGATASEVAARAQPELLFDADPGEPSLLKSWLGFNRARSGENFERAQLCFALAAVDEAGNLGERSEPLCLDTTDERSPAAHVVQGRPCESPGGLSHSHGCGAAGTGAGAASVLWVLLGAAIPRRRRG